MARGGRREGSGGKPTWKHGKTKPVRVPVALAEQVLEIARILDDEGDPGDTSKVIDLSGIAILHSQHGPVIRLADLIRVGYKIKPERLLRSIGKRLEQKSDLDNLLKRALEQYEQ